MKPHTRIGPYSLVRPLGTGARRSWLASGGSEGAQVVLKIALAEDAAACARLAHEAAIAGNLDHPNILSMHEYGRSQTLHWMSADYVAGGDTLTLANFRQLLLALLHVHGNELVHGDLRLSNLLLAPEGTLRLSNFACARKNGQAAAQDGGRSPIASPEQLRGDVIDMRADIFSAGAVLYQILTRQAYQGGAAASPSSLAPGLGDSFDAVVAKAMAPDRAQRYGHIFELLADFDAACQRGVPPVAPLRR